MLCYRSFFSCKDSTLNLRISNNTHTNTLTDKLRLAKLEEYKDNINCYPHPAFLFIIFLPFYLVLRDVAFSEYSCTIHCCFLWVWRVCVCVCVFFPSILDIKLVGRTSWGYTGGRSYRIFIHLLSAVPCLNFCREKDAAIPFPRRPRSRILCTNDLIVLHHVRRFSFFFRMMFSTL